MLFLVTVPTSQLGMRTWTIPQLVRLILMAVGAALAKLLRGDCQGRMGIFMTIRTRVLPVSVGRIMAFGAEGHTAMLFLVTVPTSQLGMRTWTISQLVRLILMAVGAALAKLLRGDCQGRMGIFMAIRTRVLPVSMGRIMAFGAKGHDLPGLRGFSMVNLMTIPTDNLVGATKLLQILVLTFMAASALGNRLRCRFGSL
jgi:hypothetical protein